MMCISDDAVKTIRAMRKSERNRLLKIFYPEELEVVLNLWRASDKFSVFYAVVLTTGIPMSRTDAYIANVHFEKSENNHKLADE